MSQPATTVPNLCCRSATSCVNFHPRIVFNLVQWVDCWANKLSLRLFPTHTNSLTCPCFLGYNICRYHERWKKNVYIGLPDDSARRLSEKSGSFSVPYRRDNWTTADCFRPSFFKLFVQHGRKTFWSPWFLAKGQQCFFFLAVHADSVQQGSVDARVVDQKKKAHAF